MRDTLATGLTRSERITVDDARAISFLGEGLRVYATPSMVNDMEYACLRLLAEHLDETESSVGVRVEMDHSGATPMGHEVTLEVTVTAIDGRRVGFEAEIRDALEVVGTGRHTRFVIDVGRHRQRLADKAARLLAGG